MQADTFYVWRPVMLIPIGDDDKKGSGLPWVTYLFILLNLIVFFYFQGAGANDDFTYGWSVIPQQITQGIDLTEAQQMEVNGEQVTIPQAPGPTPIYLTLISAMFMHGGYLHLFSNLLYLWIFGDNVEHRIGHVKFFAFYILCGLAGTAAQIALDPTSIIPNLGASGAISGVLGAYLLMFPLNQVRVLFFYIIISLPALVVIGAWIVFQFVQGYGAIVVMEESVGGVAYGAHIGGFLVGFIFAIGWLIVHWLRKRSRR